MPCRFVKICKKPIDNQEPVLTRGNYDPKICKGPGDCSELGCYNEMVARISVKAASNIPTSQGDYKQDSAMPEYFEQVVQPIPTEANIHNAKGREKITLTNGKKFHF